MVNRQLQQIVFRLHDQREKLAPSLELRRKHLTAAYLGQVRSERDAIIGHIERLPYGVRKVYLQHRLQKLNERAAMKPVGL